MADPETDGLDQKRRESDSIKVAVIGTGTGDGFENHTLAVTTGDQPNIIVKVVTPVMAVAVRFVHSYLQVLIGLVTAALAAGHQNEIMPWSDFADLMSKSARLSLAGPVVGILRDLFTIFTGLVNKYPLMSGKV